MSLMGKRKLALSVGLALLLIGNTTFAAAVDASPKPRPLPVTGRTAVTVDPSALDKESTDDSKERTDEGKVAASTASTPKEEKVQAVFAPDEVKPEPPVQPTASMEEKDYKIVINLASRSLALYDGNQKVRLYPLGLGKASTPTPVGYYKVLSKDVNPTWVDPGDERHIVPSGEANPLGYRWMQIWGNYGIHGTNRPESIGHYVSNGCIRMREQDVEELFDLVKVGTPVEITYNRVVVEQTPDKTVAYYIYPDGYNRQELTPAMVSEWLSGYGVSAFEKDEDIAKKIAASDGEPTFIGKPYRIELNGKALEGKAVIRNEIAYIPALELAKATNTALGWNAEEGILVSTYGRAAGYNEKDVLYCDAEDVEVLFRVDGGLKNQAVFSYYTHMTKQSKA